MLLASSFVFGLYSILTVAAILSLLALTGETDDGVHDVVWTVTSGLLFVIVGGFHLDHLLRAHVSWNVTGPDTLSEGQWHDFLFSRIMFWITFYAFLFFVIACAQWIELTEALVIFASFSMPVAIIWLATACRFRAPSVETRLKKPSLTPTNKNN